MAPTLRKRRRLPTQISPPIHPPSSHHDCPDKPKADTQAEARDKRVVRFHPVDQARDNGPDVYQLPHIPTKPRDTLLTNTKSSTLATNAAAVESTDTTVSPIDAIQSDLDIASTQMSMPSTSMTRPRPDLPDLDLDIEQLELNRASTSQVPGGDLSELQSVQLQAGHHCSESFRGHNTALESGIQQECDPALIQPCRSERGVAVWRRYGLSKIMSRCLLVDRGVTHEERLRYIFGPSVGSKGPPVHGPRRVVPDGQGGFKYADSAKVSLCCVFVMV
ncbi:hypothetical protein KC19_10G067300 [Ceratodon purpureus]|uniref:Uncharacterized protein n=1 Tax=Ceratodon purpureus TaxID=3225 RepID=A0A8T0GK56_CERPU|nr:hypothetical protein KC19_10G067300 [Ceratodon purpureus]